MPSQRSYAAFFDTTMLYCTQDFQHKASYFYYFVFLFMYFWLEGWGEVYEGNKYTTDAYLK